MKIKLSFSLIYILIFFFGFSSCKNQTAIDKKVEKLLYQLTLEEKINMLHASGTFTSGGVPRLGIPELRMSDGPCGIRMEINRNDWKLCNWKNDEVTYFPSQTALASTWDTSLAKKFGTALGQESKIRGKHIQLAPGINIIRTPLNGRNWEYLSEDPYLVSKMVVPIIQGIQYNGIAACVKHFALNNQETQRGFIDVDVNEQALREIYLPGFEAAVKEAEVLTIMGAYNRFHSQYATYNEYLIQDILKGEWGFKGAVISDWGACHSTLEAALCGLDIEMGNARTPFNQFYMANPLLNEVKKGKVDIKYINDKIRRILYVMLRLNVINEPKFDTSGMYKRLAIPERIALTRQIAEESIVLLKNQNNFLPLDASTIKSIAIIGDNATKKHAGGGGSTVVKPRFEITPLEALQNKFKGKVQINYARGYEVPQNSWNIDSSMNSINEKLIMEAVEVAKKSEYVLIFGGLNHNWGNDSEGADKHSMKLPYGQDKLISEIIKVNPKTAVIIICGSPVEIGGWFEKTPALLQSSYLGMEAGNAYSEVIFGDVNPSGKLSFTFPKKLKDSPAHAIGEYPGEKGKVIYKEGLFVGYRYFDSKNIEPMFPFGYGLSYTSFKYDKLAVPSELKLNDAEIPVSFEIKNTGKIDGKETAQLYIHNEKNNSGRPYKGLKGFEKASIKTGESKKVIIKIDKKAFQIYDTLKCKWVVEPGKYEILIGSSSKDIRLKGSIKLL